MRSNETAFEWLIPTQSNSERRDYAVRRESFIHAMTDLMYYPPYSRDKMHNHNCMEIGLCVAGSGTVQIEGQPVRPFRAGTVIIIPEGGFHSQQEEGIPLTRWRYIAVDQRRLLNEAMPSCRAVLEELLENGCRGIFLSDENMRSDVAWLIERMFDIKCRTAEETTAELEAILLVILMRISRIISTDDVQGESQRQITNPVEPALLYIAEQYHGEVKVAQMAKSCAMSESYFRKVFQENMGVPPIEYLNKYRIERAVHLLRTREEMPVSRIAEVCGFSSIATFNRNFARYIGQNPTEFKREKLKRA
ncbi:MAG: helix-turn-helix domain-containing protein [Clostridia bacterium]|nr:helix-turn-helix domain-containing protein [Clostridia bacterium]